VPWKLLRSVAVKPGHAALTLMPAFDPDIADEFV
jgi:hypothetical protein